MKLRFVATLLLSVSLVATVGTVPSSSATTVSPYAQMKIVVADANAELSVRVTSTATLGAKHLTSITDAGRINGRQRVTLTQSGKSDTVVVELVGGALYVMGDKSILMSYLQLSSATAKQLANQWFTITSNSSSYPSVAAGLTISSGMSEVTMTKSVRASSATTVDGVKVNVLKGTTLKTSVSQSFAETLYYSTAKDPLPVEAIQTFQGSPAAIVFGHWNETIRLVAPSVKLQLT